MSTKLIIKCNIYLFSDRHFPGRLKNIIIDIHPFHIELVREDARHRRLPSTRTSHQYYIHLGKTIIMIKQTACMCITYKPWIVCLLRHNNVEFGSQLTTLQRLMHIFPSKLRHELEADVNHESTYSSLWCPAKTGLALCLRIISALTSGDVFF